MAALVTIQEAKDRLRIDEAYSDVDLQAMAEEASDIIVNYLKARADPAWTAETVPDRIKSAILFAIKSIYDDGSAAEIIAQMDKGEGAIAAILRRDRDPALA